MLLFGLLCVGLGVAVLWPDLPIGKQLRALLIDAPARFLSKLTWAKVVAGAALTAYRDGGGHAISEGAKAKVEAAGGSVEILGG